MIGGYLLSLILIVLIFSNYFVYEKNILLNFNLIIFTVIISTTSQVGDILISYFKRLSKIKIQVKSYRTWWIIRQSRWIDLLFHFHI